jgi:hypothetical protein
VQDEVWCGVYKYRISRNAKGISHSYLKVLYHLKPFSYYYSSISNWVSSEYKVTSVIPNNFYSKIKSRNMSAAILGRHEWRHEHLYDAQARIYEGNGRRLELSVETWAHTNPLTASISEPLIATFNCLQPRHLPPNTFHSPSCFWRLLWTQRHTLHSRTDVGRSDVT